MEFHREMAERAGRPEAKRRFGSPIRLQEQARETWGWVWVDRLFQDLSFAARTLRRSPGFTITAIAVLGVGVGVNMAAFSLFNLMVLKVLPIRDPESIVRLERRSPDASTNTISYSAMQFYGSHARTLSAVMGTLGTPGLQLEDDPQPISDSFVTSNYFTELGTQPALGRLLDAQRDDGAGSAPVVVISYSLWQKRFGADAKIVGKTIRLNHKPATIIGVTPLALAALGGAHPDVWLPIAQVPYFVAGSTALNDTGSSGPVEMWGRLAPGVPAKVCEQELLQLTNELRKIHPKDIWDHEYIHSDPGGHDQIVRGDMVIAMAMAAALVLLILAVACANLGSLLLARSVAREHEISIRVAIGANRKRIFRQLFTESLLLSSLGSCQVLLSAQVTASCVLLIVSGLMVRALQHALYTNPGFGYEQVIEVDPGLGMHGYKAADARNYLDQFLDRVRAIPGVTSIALTSMPPLSHTRIATITNTINRHPVRIFPFEVDPAFFSTMEIPLLRGRNFLPGEEHAVIVSDTLARKQWPGEDPIGKQDASGSAPGDIVVGVVANARLIDMQDGDTVELYHAAKLGDMADLVVLIKTAGAPDGLTPALRSIARSLDTKLFPDIRLLKGEFRSATQGSGNTAMVVSLLGMVAALLAALGILGLVTYAVSQRSKDIAIRIALGAKPFHVLASVLGQFSWPVVTGVLAGIGITAAMSQVLRRILYGVSNLDPISYASAIGVLLTIFAVAAYLPARRALKLDVARSLHQD
jgi:hypothetical protein